MPAFEPPLRPEHVAYVEAAASILVGTCTREGVPEALRGVGIRVAPGGREATVLVPVALAGRTLDNLAGSPRIAVTTAKLPTFSTIQLKGLVRAVRDAGDADRVLAARAADSFASELAWAGEALTRTRRLNVWPCKAIDLVIETIYVEAPAPLEGQGRQ